MKKILSFIIGILLITVVLVYKDASKPTVPDTKLWSFMSIDTMKYSRDESRDKVNDPSFDQTINMQMQAIAKTGATHVAIATPYDDEFLPILKRWVASARAHNLHVWFRGNWSGWEKWFGYSGITRQEHIEKTRDFILSNRDLFADGDIFSACPECENGGPGDPRTTGDVAGYRQFLIDEYAMTKASFSSIHKNVRSNFDSMNIDVARLVMDKTTTAALDGTVTIDHYVADPVQMAQDVSTLAATSGGYIVIGEFGAPIPDIHGEMTEEQQADWIQNVAFNLAKIPSVIGVNYWTSFGGTTALWTSTNTPKKAVEAITKAYNMHRALGRLTDATGSPIPQVKVSSPQHILYSDNQGYVSFPYLSEDESFSFEKSGFSQVTKTISHNSLFTLTMNHTQESILFKIRVFFSRLKIPLA